MTQIALFHSVLGVRPGIHAAADLLRSHGHDVLIVDQYDGQVFDDYDQAAEYAEATGYQALMATALRAVGDLGPGFVCAGFSNGGGMAEHVAANRTDAAGVLLYSGALDPAMIGITEWRAEVPVQIHYATDDPFRNDEWIAALCDVVTGAGADLATFDYPGTGHLFTDPSLPDEYDSTAAALLWDRSLAFLTSIGR